MLTTSDIGLRADKIRVDASGCWLWTGAHKAEGYGFVSHRIERDGVVKKTTKPAHRIAYETAVGPIAAGLHLDHLCRVPACVNPAHLEPVTQRENLLRGIGPSAQNAVKARCIRGHDFSPENTYEYFYRGLPKRRCRACSRASQRARRSERSAA